MMSALKWLAKYWYVPVIAIVLVLLWVLSGGKHSLADLLTKEIDAIDAKSETKQVQAELGAEKALQHVHEKYRTELEKMNAEQKEQAEKLRSDPAALAVFIVRGS